MRNLLVVGALGALAIVHAACSADDTTIVSIPGAGGGGAGGAGGTAGKGGTGGTAGAGGSKASGGAAGTGGAAGAGSGGGGAGGTTGAGGDGGMSGAGGSNVVDPCEGKYRPLPFVVSSAFTTLRICSGGTCTAPAMPYYFSPIPNPNCDEVFPDGGIVPPFADAGGDGAAPADPDAGDAASDGSDAGSPSPVADAGDEGADAGAAADAGVTADTGDGAADVTAASDANDAGAGDAPADVSLGSDARAEASSEAAPVDAGAPSCYAFLYNPACTTGTCWGGVIFTQSAASNADPGICIESGATKISFKAKASRPDARIKFGSTREGLGATEFFMNITTEWATYEVSIPVGEPYNSYSAGAAGVWNGFSVIVEPGDHAGGTYIFVKDAVWMK